MKRLAATAVSTMALAVTILLGVVGFAGAASAQTTSPCYPASNCTPTSPNGGSPTTSPKVGTLSNGPAVVQPVAPVSQSTTQSTNQSTTPAVAATSSGSSLAFTGADVGGTVVVGLALIGAGAVVVRASRRRHHTA